MKILVISNSTVIVEIFKLALENKDFELEFVNHIEDAKDDFYSIIFIEEDSLNIKEQIDIIENYINYKELVSIGTQEREYSNLLLKKPFLPKDIEKFIEQIDKDLEEKDEPANVLDLEEIEKIKSLIQESEIEEELIKKDAIEKFKDKESFKVKKKKAKKFLQELCLMDESVREELLDSAKITIKIEFKD
jgi:hypothetical protein